MRNPGKRHASQGAIEFLAREWQLPFIEVMHLYDAEWAALAARARINGYLPIFALRNVRTVLRERGTVKTGHQPRRAPPDGVNP